MTNFSTIFFFDKFFDEWIFRLIFQRNLIFQKIFFTYNLLTIALQALGSEYLRSCFLWHAVLVFLLSAPQIFYYKKILMCLWNLPQPCVTYKYWKCITEKLYLFQINPLYIKRRMFFQKRFLTNCARNRRCNTLVCVPPLYCVNGFLDDLNDSLFWHWLITVPNNNITTYLEND